MVGLGIALIGSIICMFAPSGEILIFGRLIQGAGMGSPMPLGRVVLRDLFTGVELARWNSYIGAFLLLAPALAPILGGYLAYNWDWTSIFVFLVVFILIISMMTGFFLPETRARPHVPLAFEFQEIFKHYLTILKNKTFIAYALVSAIALGGMVAYLTLSAFLFQQKLGFTIIEYSWTSVFVSAALITGMLSNAWLLYYFNFNKLIITGLILKCIAGAFLLSAILLGLFTAVSLIISIMLFSLGCSLVFANAASGAFMVFNHRLGMVGALYGSTQMFIAGGVGTLVSFSQAHADLVLAICLLLLGLIGLFGFTKMLGKNANLQ
jgi:DHA1 family bicyclomycin/chloramphenicol resistance-like MFS transporter